MWGRRRTRAAAVGRSLPFMGVIPHAFRQGRRHIAVNGSRDTNAFANKGAVARAPLSGGEKAGPAAGVHPPPA